MEDPIKKKIQELCPDIAKRCNGGSPCLCEMILLSDVLRAIYALDCKRTDGETHYLRLHVELDGSLIFKDGPYGEWSHRSTWNLLNDNYDAQAKETQLFIGSLLGV